MDNQVFRLRIIFAKRGALRYLSHLEVSRAFERLIRRSGLPYKISQGFNPHMCHAFGPALPVGTSGLCEQLDLDLNSYLPADEALERLRQSAPDGLEPQSCKYVAHNSDSLTKILTLASYEIELAVSDTSADDLNERFAGLRAKGELTLFKKGKEKVYNLGQILVSHDVVEGTNPRAQDRDYVAGRRGSAAQTYSSQENNGNEGDGRLCNSPQNLPVQPLRRSPGVDSFAATYQLHLALRLLPTGSLRPEQIIAAALADTPYTINSITRIALEVEGDS